MTRAGARAHQGFLEDVREARSLRELAAVIERARGRFIRNETLVRFVEDAALDRAAEFGWLCPRRAHEGRAAHTERCAHKLLADAYPVEEQLRLLNGRRRSVAVTPTEYEREYIENIGRDGHRWRLIARNEVGGRLGYLQFIEFQGVIHTEELKLHPSIYFGAFIDSKRVREGLQDALLRFASEEGLHMRGSDPRELADAKRRLTIY